MIIRNFTHIIFYISGGGQEVGSQIHNAQACSSKKNSWVEMSRLALTNPLHFRANASNVPTIHSWCQSPKYENGFKHSWHLVSGNV